MNPCCTLRPLSQLELPPGNPDPPGSRDSAPVQRSPGHGGDEKTQAGFLRRREMSKNDAGAESSFSVQGF